jgi:hypothetical protein
LLRSIIHAGQCNCPTGTAFLAVFTFAHRTANYEYLIAAENLAIGCPGSAG